ncbi:unnamed protein product, partial [Symbiodinium necroappetens]
MVLRLFRDMASRRVSVVNYNTAISALGREGQWQLAGQMLGDMAHASESASEWELAVQTFSSMMEDMPAAKVHDVLQPSVDKVSPDASTGNAVISACGKLLVKNLACCELYRGADSVVLSAWIAAMDLNAHWRLSMQLLRSMPEMKITPDTVSFNTTMSILEVLGNFAGQWALTGHLTAVPCAEETKAAQLWEEALDLFRSMLEARISPDRFSYNAAMSAGAQGGQWQLTRQFFGTMRDAEVMPDMYCYSTLCTAYSAASQWQLAVQLFHSMPAGVATDAVFYNTAMLAYQTGEQWQPSLQLFEDMRTAKIPADVL